MHCPFCDAEETKVVDSRLVAEGFQVRRRRECFQCHERFTTFETAELIVPRVIKSDETREPFDDAKLRRSIQHAVGKLPVSEDDIEKSMSRIIHQLQATGEREVPSKLVGNLVLEELKALNKVAYIRFASVYLSFEDINEFTKEIEKLKDLI